MARSNPLPRPGSPAPRPSVPRRPLPRPMHPWRPATPGRLPTGPFHRPPQIPRMPFGRMPRIPGRLIPYLGILFTLNDLNEWWFSPVYEPPYTAMPAGWTRCANPNVTCENTWGYDEWRSLTAAVGTCPAIGSCPVNQSLGANFVPIGTPVTQGPTRNQIWFAKVTDPGLHRGTIVAAWSRADSSTPWPDYVPANNPAQWVPEFPTPWWWHFPWVDPFLLPINTPVPTPVPPPFRFPRPATWPGWTPPTPNFVPPIIPEIPGWQPGPIPVFPRPAPRPAPGKRPRPGVRPRPGPVPMSPPLPRPTPRPTASPGPAWVPAVEFVPFAPPRGTWHGNKPPRPGVRERKRRGPVPPWMMAAVNGTTEGNDFLNAMWWALPPDARTRGANPFDKWGDLMRYFDSGRPFDWSAAATNWANNHAEDGAWGRFGGMGRPGSANLFPNQPGRGTQTGPWDGSSAGGTDGNAWDNIPL